MVIFTRERQTVGVRERDGQTERMTGEIDRLKDRDRQRETDRVRARWADIDRQRWTERETERQIYREKREWQTDSNRAGERVRTGESVWRRVRTEKAAIVCTLKFYLLKCLPGAVVLALPTLSVSCDQLHFSVHRNLQCK